MKNAPFEEIPVPADSKDESAVAARKRLTEALAELNPAAGYKGEGSGRGDKTKKDKKKADAAPAPAVPEAKAATTPSAKPAAELDPAVAERAAKFDRLDKDKRGRLTREEYRSRQSDPEAAAKRFEKFDTNRDGFVTRDEFINNGAKKPK